MIAELYEKFGEEIRAHPGEHVAVHPVRGIIAHSRDFAELLGHIDGQGFKREEIIFTIGGDAGDGTAAPPVFYKGTPFETDNLAQARDTTWVIALAHAFRACGGPTSPIVPEVDAIRECLESLVAERTRRARPQ